MGATCSNCGRSNVGLSIAPNVTVWPDEYGSSRTTLCYSCWRAAGRQHTQVTNEEMQEAKTLTKSVAFQAVQQNHKQAAVFTQEQLAKKPHNASDAAILPHLLKAMAGNRAVTFGCEGSSSADSAIHMLHGLDQKGDDSWDLKLSGPPDWSTASSIRDVIDDPHQKRIFEIEAQRRIACSLQVSESDVDIISITEGSINVKYTVKDLSTKEKERILEEDVTGQLRGQFNTFVSLNIAPAVLALHFNLSDLDTRGNKDFGADGGGTFQVGGRTYHQPSKGWVRYGLKVLGKQSDDKWLAPFQHQGNWCRGFHGIRGFAKQIADEGFNESTHGKMGAGVYVSPFVDYAEGYAGCLPVETTSGAKSFKVVLQVAVNPSGIMKEGYPRNGENQEWTARSSNVRPYGLLIKEC